MIFGLFHQCFWSTSIIQSPARNSLIQGVLASALWHQLQDPDLSFLVRHVHQLASKQLYFLQTTSWVEKMPNLTDMKKKTLAGWWVDTTCRRSSFEVFGGPSQPMRISSCPPRWKTSCGGQFRTPPGSKAAKKGRFREKMSFLSQINIINSQDRKHPKTPIKHINQPKKKMIYAWSAKRIVSRCAVWARKEHFAKSWLKLLAVQLPEAEGLLCSFLGDGWIRTRWTVVLGDDKAKNRSINSGTVSTSFGGAVVSLKGSN